MSRTWKWIAAGVTLLVALGTVAGIAYPRYAADRCLQDLQDVEDSAYGAMFSLTGDQDESFEYRYREQLRVMQSRWCQAT